ncbi:C20orf27 isoform 1, partial [Pongo abelii]
MAAANRGNKPRVRRSICFAAGHDTEGSHVAVRHHGVPT